MMFVLLASLGAIAGACAMYLWCRRATVRDCFHCEVLGSRHLRIVRLVLDERTHELHPDDALSLGAALTKAATDMGAS